MKERKWKVSLLNGNKLLLFCVFALSFLYSCNSKIDPDQVEALKFRYLSREITTPMAIKESQEIFLIEIFKDTIIRDRNTIEDYIKLVNALVPSRNDRVCNLRIVSFIKVEGREKNIELSFGWNDFIVYQGQLMENNQEMFNFFDQLLPEEVFMKNK